jgi:hypothetical protein
MRAWPAQYEKPARASLPQNAKSAAPGWLIGQRHLPWASSKSEQHCPPSTKASGAAVGSARNIAFAASRNSRRCEGSRGGRTCGGHARAGTAAGRPGDRPRRWILPMTALRVTPISAAIWLQVRPATTQFRSCSTRSGFQVATGDGSVMEWPRECAAGSAPQAGRSRRTPALARAREHVMGAKIRCSRAQGVAFTEPHPRLSDCQPDVFQISARPGLL